MQTMDVPETVIHMSPLVRGQVESGHLARIWRPGHRGYEIGPATILFNDGEIIPVQITNVKHTVAEGLEKRFMEVLRELGQQAPDGDAITLIEFEVE